MLSGIDAGDKMVYLTDACTGLDQEKEDMVEQPVSYTHLDVYKRQLLP